MRALITGASASGKSQVAEDLALSASSDRVYLATMQAYGEEGARRVARHRKMREGKGFATVERPRDLASLDLGERDAASLDPVFHGLASSATVDACADGRVVLLECLGNLIANEMFLEDGSCLSAEDVAAVVLRGIGSLEGQCEHIVVVSNDVGSSGDGYDSTTNEYVRCIGMVSCALASRYDVVAEVVAGVPIVAKGRLPWDLSSR